MSVYKNRTDGGEKLAAKLAKFSLVAKAKKEDLIVLGLPRGGVITAAVVAEKLGASLSVLVAKKIGYPANPEYALGAIAEGGEPVWGTIVTGYHFHEHALEAMADKALGEIDRQVKAFRGKKKLPVLKKKIVILVDDGVATGMTMRAAIQVVKKKKPKKIIVATPVIPPEEAKNLKKLVSAVVAVSEPPDFDAVAQYYVEFLQVTDEEVVKHLSQSS